eukprot:2344684-Amphidinium_carterae.1
MSVRTSMLRVVLLLRCRVLKLSGRVACAWAVMHAIVLACPVRNVESKPAPKPPCLRVYVGHIPLEATEQVIRKDRHRCDNF